MEDKKITKVTRRDILLSLLRDGIDVEPALRAYFDLSKLPSFDGRYENMEGDFYQHRVNNDDWDEEWFIDDRRLQILELPDDEFLTLLCKVIHPELLPEEEVLKKVLTIYNGKLGKDGFEVVPSAEISGRPVFE
ncbi:MAG TPA: hypothetical protein PK765_05955 [bacterium]|nr:hypothetical protein [bacterium]